MPKDQVEIKFGPARFDSPKAVRRAIEDTATETEQNTINTIINDPNIDLGGGAAGISGVIVDTYDAATGTGTGTGTDGTSYTFDNGTGVFLVPGDEIFLLGDEGGDFTAVGVTDRSGAQTPINQPIASLSTGFPLQTNAPAIPFKIQAAMGNVGLGATYAYDMVGALGYGADLIVGPDVTSATAVNAFARSTATSISLFPAVSTAHNQFYIQQANGRVISMNNTNTAMNYRLPGAGSWTAAPTTGTIYWTFDYESGAVWGITQSALTPFAYTVYRFLSTDAAPVNMGSMGIPNGYTSALHPWIASGHGYLTMSSRSSASVGNYYVKPSGDSTNFTFQGSYSTGSWAPSTNQQRVHVNPAGSTTYLTQTSPTSIRELQQGGVILSFNTGIPLTTTHPYSHRTNASGLVMVECSVLASVFGGSGTVYTPAIASFNGSTTAYQYYNISRYTGNFGSGVDMTSIVETSAGTIRFGFASQSLGVLDVIELSGL